MTAPHIVFCDIETTGLHPFDHEIWEVAAIRYDPSIREVLEVAVWQLAVDLEAADPVALEMGRFHERRWAKSALVPAKTFAKQFAAFCEGAHLCGAVISFDDKRLERLMLSYDIEPTWHYHIIDVEALAIGYLSGRYEAQKAWFDVELAPVARSLPWSSSKLTEALGLNIDEATKHTAEGDARWAMAIWETCVPQILHVASRDEASTVQDGEAGAGTGGGGCGGRIGPNG